MAERANHAARVQLQGVTKAYLGAGALNGIDLDVGPGEVVCLLGPSGCGKTTLLRVVSGIERPTSGRVLIGGNEVAGPQRFVPPEVRGVGLMFQDFALFPHLSVLENVAFGLRAQPREDARSVAREMLDRVGLLPKADTYPSTLSGGQQQRVALARALVPRPAVMLMDEPFSGLDVQLRSAMQDETLALLKEMSATSLIVTHDPEEAMRMGNRIVVMRSGLVVQAGTARELYGKPADIFVARLFSQINEILATVRGGALETPLGVFHAPGLADGTAALVCLREHAISLASAGNGVPGSVSAIKFLGDSAIAEVAVPGLARRLQVRVPGGTALTPGALVAIHADPAQALVFVAETIA